MFDVNDTRILIISIVYAALGMVLLYVGYRLFDWLTPTNLGMLALAALGVLGWTTLTDPTAAAACAAAADAAGLVAMMPKTWADPFSETVSTYALAGVTGLLGALAVHAWTAALLYPVYFCLGNAATALAIALRRRGCRVLHLADARHHDVDGLNRAVDHLRCC